ncbi:MAG: Wzz/FepE/Etk N-terminal domain-containing protein [Terracidiphilus sp.]|jgi:polysaccharide chain length determinant protein (PEP-CTERM system associated)
MLGHRDLTMEDYAGILKRRYKLILSFALVLLVVGFGVTFVLSPQYQSQTLVLVEQQKVPENYVKPVVTEDLGARLASMKEQILSRSRLEPIITKYNLFASSANMDDRVELTQKAIGVQPIASSSASHGMPGFFITFKANDARTAQQVCADIEGLFVQENISARQQSAEGTTDFLKQQLAESKRNLDEQDAKLAAFEKKYLDKLPGTEPGNANTLQALTSQLDATTQALNRDMQDETFLQATIAQQSQQMQNVVAGSPVTVETVDERERELRALKEQKATLETTYTPDYPDVVALSRRISDLEAQIAHSTSVPALATASSQDASVATRRDPPELLQTRFKLRSVMQSIAETKQEQARIQQKIKVYEDKVESSPLVEEEYKQVTRDHDVALGFYNSLLAKMNESSMATALEQRQEGEQFSVMDAPNLPENPSFPNRYAFAGGGFAGGLLLGLLLSAFLEYRDTALRNERDVWAFTKLPTLAVISHIGDLPQTDKPKGRWNPFSRSPKPIESVSL